MRTPYRLAAWPPGRLAAWPPGRLAALSLLTLSATAGAVCAQTRDAEPMTSSQSHQRAMRARDQANPSPDKGPLGNDPKMLEDGTASGKGSGPGAGSPNGN